MSKKTKTKTTEENPMNPETLQERVDKAYIAKGYTLLNGGSDNILMIQGEKNEKNADILMTFEGIKEMVVQLEPDTLPKEKNND
jgi:hypothetical protein